MKHRVPRGIDRQRLVDYCGPVFRALTTKSATKKAIKRGDVLLDGQRATGAEWLYGGEVIILKAQKPVKSKAYDAEMDIIYEDDYLMIVNKPAGLATNGNRHSTVEHAITGKYKPSSVSDALVRPMAVHRLDVATRGLLILAKAKSAQVKLGRMLQNQQVQKTYHAIVHGQPDQQGSIDHALEGKAAHTDFKCIRTVSSRIFGQLSLVRLLPKTGRTHQLRKHLVLESHLILGDKAYADGQRTLLGKGLFLAATGLSFRHPVSGAPLDVSIDIPQKFVRVLDREEQRY